MGRYDLAIVDSFYALTANHAAYDIITLQFHFLSS